MNASAFFLIANRFWWAIMLIACLALTALSARQISTNNIKGDALQNLDISLNLYHHKSFARSNGKKIHLTNFREPIPALVTSTYFALSGKDTSYLTISNLRTGDPAKFVKLHNLGWVFLGLIASWLLLNEVTKTRLGGGFAAAACYLLFFNNIYIVNSLYTELATGVFLLWVAWLMVKATQTLRLSHFLISGIVLGLLCLTKSAFLYVAPLIILTIVFRPKAMIDGDQKKRFYERAVRALFMTCGTLIIVAPWMVRNHMLFDTAQITSGRSGWVLYKRALLNQMTAEEFRGGFAVFGPDLYRHLVKDTFLSVEPEDMTSKHGRFRRLYAGPSEFSQEDLRAQTFGKPENAISFYRKTSATFIKLSDQMKKQGLPHPELLADKMMQAEAKDMILSDPMRHLVMGSLMFWRGFWNLSSNIDIPLLNSFKYKTYTINVINAVLGVSLIVIFLSSFLKRNAVGLSLTIAPILMMAFYTSVSQNLPRFFAPTVPIMIVSTLMITQCILLKLKAKMRIFKGADSG